MKDYNHEALIMHLQVEGDLCSGTIATLFYHSKEAVFRLLGRWMFRRHQLEANR